MLKLLTERSVFNNEQDLFKATYDSVINEDLGNGLQIKEQNEIIGKDGSFTKPRYRQTFTNNALTLLEDEQFVDALTRPTISKVPSKEIVENLIN
ncbi:unnamed protein product [Rhizophagus irregularis]|nr:unnamed protein product [Rhizophagus irregularis]